MKFSPRTLNYFRVPPRRVELWHAARTWSDNPGCDGPNLAPAYGAVHLVTTYFVQARNLLGNF